MTNVSLIQEQKLRSELALVKGNLTVMSELLNELTPGQSQQDDTELLQVCVCVCRHVLHMLWGHKSVYTVTLWGVSFLLGDTHPQ